MWILSNAPEIISIVKEILSLINPHQLGGLKAAIEAGIKANDVEAVKKAVSDMHSVSVLPDLVKC